MAVDYLDWIKKTGVNRPSEEKRMGYVKYIAEHEPNLAPHVQYEWMNVFARDVQVPYYFSNSWTTFALIGGRGLGKTRTTTEWIRYLVKEKHPTDAITIGVICPVHADVEQIFIKGSGGIFNVFSPEDLKGMECNINAGRIKFPNGTLIYFYSAENEDRLRGKQWHYCILDELAAYLPERIAGVLSQVEYCLRLTPPGKDPITGKRWRCQKMITTTPLPQPWIRRLFKEAVYDEDIVIAGGSTYDNKANLDETLFKSIIKHEGTKLGDQEIWGKVLLNNTDGIIRREWIQLYDSDSPLPRLKYIFGSYDCAASEKQENDPSAMVMFGVFKDRDGDNSVITLDWWSEHLGYPDLRAQILLDWNRRFGDGHDNRKKPICFVIENKSNGQAILTDLNKMGIKFIKYTPGRGDDKISRMNAISHLIKNGRLYMPESRKNRGKVHTKFQDLYDQLCDFPLVEHDDLADCVSQAFIIFFIKGLIIGDETERDYDAFSMIEDEGDEEPFVQTKNPYII